MCLLKFFRRGRGLSPNNTTESGISQPVKSPEERNHSSGGDQDLLSRPKSPDNARSETDPSVEVTIHDLWDLAYLTLREREPELVQNYQEILLLEESNGKEVSSKGLGVTGTAMHEERLRALANQKLEALENSFKVRVRGHELKVGEKIDQVVKVVIAAKDFVGSAVSAEPHAALIWAGICVILPLLLNPTEQFQALQEGLESVPLIVHRFRLYEHVLSQTSMTSPTDNDLKLKDVSTVVQQLQGLIQELYVRILEYQAQAVCQLSRHAVNRYIRGVFKIDNWKSLLDEINGLVSKCTSLMEAIDSYKLDSLSRKWDDLLLAFYKQDSAWKDIQHAVHAMDNKLDQKAQERRSQQKTKLEIECYQAFNDPTEPSYVDYKDANPMRIPKTCQWFLTHRQFIGWRDNQSSTLLWLSADPGCGKSVLCRALIDEELLSVKSNNVTVCYYFFKDNANQRSATKALSALLHQLFSKNPHIIKYAMDAYKQFKSQISKIFSVMWSILASATADPDAGEIVCILDALDECEEPNPSNHIPGRNHLIERIGQLCTQPSNLKSSVKFLLTSRPYVTIERAFRRIVPNLDRILLKGEDQTDAISQEINLVIRSVVPKIAIELHLEDEVQSDLLQRLLLSKNRTYLWLHLIFHEIQESLGCTTSPALKALIEKLPSTVEEAYEGILSRVDSKHRERALRLLQVVIAADAPLSLKELNVILAVRGHMQSCDELHLESEEAFQVTVRNSCGLFVRVLDSKIYLIHNTASKFLLSEQKSVNKQFATWGHSFSVTEANRTLGGICMYYLLFTDYSEATKVGSALLNWGWDNAHFPGRDGGHDEFLDHATLHWTRYACRGKYDDDIDTFNMALRLFTDEGHFQFWTKFFRHHEQVRTVSYGLPHEPLTLASYTGLRKVAVKLTNPNTVNDTEFYGCTALYWAVYQGHLGITGDLLDAHANTEIEGIKGMPLHAAVEKHNLPMVKLLLGHEHSANVNATTNYEYHHPEAINDSPLHRAASCEMATLLLQHGANIEATDVFGNTPLIAIACHDDRIGALNVLLLSGCNVNARGKEGSTALSHAVWCTKRRHVVEMLLKFKADPNLANDKSETPLHEVLKYERFQADTHGIVECLLQAGADVTARTSEDGTPLQLAIEAGQHPDIINLLLDYGANINAPNMAGGVLHSLIPVTGRTEECVARKKELLSFLIAKGANIEAKDEAHRFTPLLKAVYEGDIFSANLLLEQGASVEATNNRHQNAIDIAISEGHSEILMLIVKARKKGS